MTSGGEVEATGEPATHVDVIDCTLRDGEQTPGVWFSTQEKLELASLLDAAGVDVLDAGFPGASEEDVETLQALRDEASIHASIGATARAVRADVVAAERARAHEVFLFLPTSDLRLFGLGLSRDEAAARIRATAEETLARGMGLNIVAEDAYRADPAWLAELWTTLRHLPVRRLVLCDTVGAALPDRMAQLVRALRPRIDPSVDLCAHCHNDFGMATANTLAAVAAGARAVTCTVNGIGERAGNADLAEVVAALTHLMGRRHNVHGEALGGLAACVERLSGVHASPLKAVTGANVYSHESGVHVDGMLKDPRSYEFLPAAWTGRTSAWVLGKHSGTALLRHLLATAGVGLSEPELRALLGEVKTWSRGRDKDDYGRAYADALRFRRRALGGLPVARLVDRARAMSEAREPDLAAQPLPAPESRSAP